MPVRPLTTAVNCLDLLDLIAAAGAPVRLADAARLSGQSRATTYQRLLTLVTAGWLERLSDDTYRLSLTACRIANAALEQAGFGDRALPVLQSLTDLTGETSSLVALENVRLIIAQRVEARGVLRADLRVGAELSFDDSASGKVWLAFGPDDLSERLAAGTGAKLREEERRSIQADGCALGGGGLTLPGIAVLAAPVLDDRGRCLASLSLVGPETRFDADRLRQPLLAAAEQLRSIFGGRVWRE
ncbi:MAG: helix-turn-helix domain-containing protein [Pseudomonadota bacterium]